MASSSSSKDPITSSFSTDPISSGSNPISSPTSFPSFPSDAPTTSIHESFLYDVFLSFRGIDTRYNFTSHLYDRLVMAGIHTFMDDDELQSGVEISQQLMTAIEKSRIYIVVFSQNYASSRWCLDELVKIIECSKKQFRVLIPVFYGVQPHEVRWQAGSFDQSFKNHEALYINQLDMVMRWKRALYKSAEVSGFNLQLVRWGKSESRLISLIIEEVLSRAKPKKLFVAKHPVGVDSRVNDIYPLLRLASDHHVRLIGIYGMGGSGKTVIARSLYNKILQSFDSSCFLANVKEVSQQSNGLVYLQEQLISELLMRKIVNVGSVYRGIEMIRERLCRRKVLIVLDDTDRLSQVDALAGHRNWFGPGSVIIITTRDQHLLNQVKVDGRYEAKVLNTEESLELFSWHCFEKLFPLEPYALIADKIVAYACGLPLALEVLGAFLFERSVEEWNSAFESLQKVPPHEIQQILKISYDGLDNDEHREIFLDIACFFIGMDIDYVTEILNGCSFSTEIGIGILKIRCLLTVDRNNQLRMHDLLRNMGREIIRQQFPREAGKRSRLWSHQLATYILKGNKGTEAILGITLVCPIEEEIHVNTENFARMHNLRLLQMDNVSLDGSFEHVSEEIRWISWRDYSLKHLPSNMQTRNLVVMDMQHSKLGTLWQGNQVNTEGVMANLFSWMGRLWKDIPIQLPSHLKILNLSHSKCLTSTPDFTRVPNLVTLILEGCTSLVQIDPSIGCLASLLVLNLKGCEKITTVPSEVCILRLLGYLNLSGCSKLQELPEDLGHIESLRELYADETAITGLPSVSYTLVNLRTLSLRGCYKMLGYQPLSGSLLADLRRLNLRDCNLSYKEIRHLPATLPVLQELDLAGNNLSELPTNFTMFTKLESLSLDNWSILMTIPGLPPNLEALVAKSVGASKTNLPTDLVVPR